MQKQDRKAISHVITSLRYAREALMASEEPKILDQMIKDERAKKEKKESPQLSLFGG